MKILSRKQKQQLIRELRPIDDDFMRCMFHDNIPLAQMVLRTLTGIDDLVLKEEETEKDIKSITGARSLRLDIYSISESDIRFNLETQRSKEGAIPQRARYHSSVMDFEALEAGQPFNELPDIYVIFLTEQDIFHEGKPIYLIQRMNMTTMKPFEDGTRILYVNGAYRGNDPVGRLMHDFCCNDPEEMYNEEMKAAARYYKGYGKGEVQVSRIFEKYARELYADEFREIEEEKKRLEERKRIAEERERIAEERVRTVRFEGRLESIHNLMSTMNMTAEQAMDALIVPAEEREALLSRI